MITLKIDRGSAIPRTEVSGMGHETGTSIILDASDIDVQVTASLKYGNSKDADKAVNMMDTSTDEQITITAAAGAVAGVQIKDIYAPFIFLALASTSGKVAPVISEPDSTPADVSCSVEATVNPGGSATDVFIEFGTEEGVYTGGFECDESPIAVGTSDVDVSATLADLDPETTYYWRVRAVNSLGTTYSDEQTFTTTEA